MTELKFKLKKDGRCVGYMRLRRAVGLGNCVLVSYPEAPNIWHTVNTAADIDFDSIHPWICKDRNGKDVYDGDKVLANGKVIVETSPGIRHMNIPPTCHMESKRLTFEVVWDDGFMAWGFRSKHGSIECDVGKRDIELIENQP